MFTVNQGENGDKARRGAIPLGHAMRVQWYFFGGHWTHYRSLLERLPLRPVSVAQRTLEYDLSTQSPCPLVQIPVRNIEKTYDDPLSLVWINAAARMGMRVERSAEVNASWDGDGVLTIGTSETLDPDDCLAQMVLHETCHALCEGPDSLLKLDWGLDNFDPTKKVHEHACLRLQAALADQHGMRSFFAATTMFRSYYDRLPAEPLAASDDAMDALAITQAKAGWERAQNGPWANALQEALRRTAQIASVLHGLTTDDSLWHGQGCGTEAS